MNRLRLFLVALALAAWACGLPTRTPTPARIRTPRPTATVVAPTPRATTALPSPSPSPAPVSPSPTAVPTGAPVTPSPTPLPLALQIQVFDNLWQTIVDTYLYPDFNGLDMGAVKIEYHERIQAGLSNDTFYLALSDLVIRLGDEHSYFLDPQGVAEEDAAYAGNNDYVGIGVLLDAVPERQRAVILAVFPGSPAQEAGLQAHDSILLVEGQSILDDAGEITTLLRGPAGEDVTIVAQTPGELPRTLTLTRRRITSAAPVDYLLLTSPAGQSVAYITLVTYNDSTVDDQVGEALRAMSAQTTLDAIILDNRPNSGGAEPVMAGVLGYFTDGLLGHFVSRDYDRPFVIESVVDIGGSSTLPLVVLIGQSTNSYGEVSSGILQDAGRATLIGETTGGNVETLWGYDFADGSRAWIAHESFRPRNQPNANWEASGIVPDIVIASAWDEITPANDPAIAAALAFFDGAAP